MSPLMIPNKNLIATPMQKKALHFKTKRSVFSTMFDLYMNLTVYQPYIELLLHIHKKSIEGFR